MLHLKRLPEALSVLLVSQSCGQLISKTLHWESDGYRYPATHVPI